MKDGVRFLFCDNIAGITYPMWNRCNFISAINAVNRCNFNIGILQYTFYETFIHEIYRIKIQQKFLSVYHGNDSHCNVLSTSQLEIYKFKSTRKYSHICD